MPQLEEWLALIHTEQLGSATLNKLLNSFGSVEALLGANRSELQSAGAPKQVIKCLHEPNEEAIVCDLEWLQHESHYLITIEDDTYPTLLKQISDAPIALYALSKQKHAIQMLSEPQLAIVGSRSASANGKQIAMLFAQQLAQAGLIITSGLASGIDGAAHHGALQAPIGATVAVAACGLDRVYPAKHKKLAEKISQQGIIVSEFPIGKDPVPGHFPRRNRIISGLSLGVLVVEASLKSGSLITARLAGEQGREVFAIPGSIHSPNSKGCHELIRNGAKLVETVEDILEELKQHIDLEPTEGLKINSTANLHALDPEYEKVLSCMGYEPISVDNVVTQSGLNVEKVSSILLILELNGYVSHNGNGIYVRTYQA